MKRLTMPLTSSLSRLTVAASFVTVSLLSGQVSADDSHEQAARFSTGLSIGSAGIGITTSSTTQWHLTETDQIQWRVMASGMGASFDKDDDFDLEGIDYNDGSFSLFALQGGFDWYPVNSGWADEIFVSTGLILSTIHLDVEADTTKDMTVGGQQVNAGELTSLSTEMENEQVLPYLSVGWGNKITGERGFDFQAEIGVALQTSDTDVSVTAIDPNAVLSVSDLAAEKREIENEADGAVAFATATVSYHF